MTPRPDELRHRPPSRAAAARRAAYSAAAGAAALTAASGHAEVRYSGVQNLAIPQTGAQLLYLDGDGFADLVLKNYVDRGGNYQGAYVSFSPGKLVGFSAGQDYVSALDAGRLVDATAVSGGHFAGAMAYGGNLPNAEFNQATGKFIGFAFPIGGAKDQYLHYAWVRVTINNEAGTFVINDWAYNDEAGAGIITGRTGSGATPGDYNADGAVDAADYTVWRDNLGTGFHLFDAGDESGESSGVVDQADYNLWRANYGGATQPAATPTPEPTTLSLLAAGSLGLAALRRGRGSRTQ